MLGAFQLAGRRHRSLADRRPGSVTQALSIAQAELASLEESGGLDRVGPLLTEAALIAWYCGDGTAARTFVDRGLEAARRLGDVDLEIRARRFDVIIGYGQHGEPEVALARLQDIAAIASAHGLAIAESWTRLLLSLFTGAAQGGKEARQASEHAGAWFWLSAMYLVFPSFALR
jgi:hypothetical protein